MLRTAVLLLACCLFPTLAHAEQVGGYTNLTHDSGHGTQIEYLSRGGKAFLWYPGNSVILEGRWKEQGADICFAYGENTYNPVTGTAGGGWECMPFRLFWGGISERMQGDVLSLEGRGAVPFKLTRERTTLERLLARIAPGAAAPPVEVGVITPNGEVALSCASIIANAERSPSDMQIAASTYFYGTFMGKACVEVDYDRAFALATKAGVGVEPFLRVLRERAANGHPRAISALERLGY